MTTITPGYILTDLRGAHVGLSLADVEAVLAEWACPWDPADRTVTSQRGDLRIWRDGERMLVSRLGEEPDGTSSTWSPSVHVGAEAIALLRGILASQERPAPAAPSPDTIDVRIRLGVTAGGEWSACGASDAVMAAFTYDADTTIADDLADIGHPYGGAVAAWHWITARIPKPVVERGNVAGEVES